MREALLVRRECCRWEGSGSETGGGGRVGPKAVTLDWRYFKRRLLRELESKPECVAIELRQPRTTTLAFEVTRPASLSNPHCSSFLSKATQHDGVHNGRL